MLSRSFSRLPFSQLLPNPGPYPALALLVLIAIHVNIFYHTLFSVASSSFSIGSFFPGGCTTKYTALATENLNINTYI